MTMQNLSTREVTSSTWKCAILRILRASICSYSGLARYTASIENATCTEAKASKKNPPAGLTFKTKIYFIDTALIVVKGNAWFCDKILSTTNNLAGVE